MVLAALVASLFGGNAPANNGGQGGQDGEGGQQGEEQQANPSFLQKMLQMLMWYYIITMVMKSMTSSNNSDANNNNVSTAVNPSDPNSPQSSQNMITSTNKHQNYWAPETPYNIRVYLTESEEFFDTPEFDESALVYEFADLRYENVDMMYQEYDMNISLSAALQKNGSLFAHVVMHRIGYPYLSSDSDFDYEAVIYETHPLVTYRKLVKKKKQQNLLFGSDPDSDSSATSKTPSDACNADSDDADQSQCKDTTSQSAENSEILSNSLESMESMESFESFESLESLESLESDEVVIVGHFRPELTIRPLCDWTVFRAGQIPPQIRDEYQIDYLNNKYWPVLYFDDFWILSDRLIPLNKSVTSVPLKIVHSPISQWKFMLQTSMTQQYQQQAEWGLSGGSAGDEDQDAMKRLLVESNPYLLGVTFFVSLLHSLFDFLAFKNDVQFWRKKKSVVGISVRTMFLNCFFQTVIFLYLMDQEETSWVILISSGVGVIIEYWKVTQASKVSFGVSPDNVVTRRLQTFGVEANLPLPWVKVENKESYEESDTAKYDKEAMRYLSFAIYPLLIGYSVYSLIYYEHKGWYSFVLQTLVSFIYMFGFIMMCPQLYLNYKLKSVAHLPWRMLTYKFLNTIIDDLFAFLITMPTLHRLSCFRDDLIFLIFLYQKWVYKTDYTRTNEYGYTPTKAEEAQDAQGQIEDDNKQEQEEQEQTGQITAAADNVENATESEKEKVDDVKGQENDEKDDKDDKDVTDKKEETGKTETDSNSSGESFEMVNDATDATDVNDTEKPKDNQSKKND